MSQPTVDQVIGLIIKLRNEKDAKEAAVKEEVKAIKEKMAKLEAYLREQADALGVTSFRTKHGTAFITTVDFATVADWDAVLKFVRDNEAYDMLERRVSKTAVRSYLELNKEVPAGVTYGTRLEVNIRKPTTKAED